MTLEPEDVGMRLCSVIHNLHQLRQGPQSQFLPLESRGNNCFPRLLDGLNWIINVKVL